MIIDKLILDQLCQAAKLDLKSKDQSKLLLELESILHLFRCVDKFSDDDVEHNLSHPTPFRQDITEHESLKSYLDTLRHFDETKHMFEVPKVIESE